MRYGASARNPLEWVAFHVGKVPLPILDTIVPLVQARALIAAGTCGIFAELSRGRCTAKALANACGLDADCTELVLRVLESSMYTRRDGNGWQLGRFGEQFFGAQATERYDGFLNYGPAQADFIGNMERVLRTGTGVDFHDNQDADTWRHYQDAMLENARSFAWFISKFTPVPKGSTSCLDIAGAHGLVGGTLALSNPPLQAMVLDRPEALATSCALGEGEPWHSLVKFVAGNLLTDDLGDAQHDVVVLANILHHFDADQNADIVMRAARALKPGGVMSIFDIERPASDAPPESAGDSFALYFRITSTSACFRAGDYIRWLTRAGLRARVVRSVRMPSRMLVLGSRE